MWFQVEQYNRYLNPKDKLNAFLTFIREQQEANAEAEGEAESESAGE